MTVPSALLSAPAAPGHSVWRSRSQAFGVLLLCVLARVATTIHHIEDADSLRFALGVIDFDVTRLQPQFPGYAAFMGAAKLLYAVTGSYALAFSTIGGLGLFVLLHYSLRLLSWRFTEPRGLILGALFVFNPMMWLLGNRYMSDLSGAACMLAAFYHLSRADSRRHLMAGFFLAGILAGWRLSYAPFLFAPLIFSIARRPAPRAVIAPLSAATAGVLAWLAPLVLVTGWDELVATARHQTSAHFLATGGTYVTESSWVLRVQRTFAHLATDGLGAWAPGRHPVTLVVAVGALFLLLYALASGRDALRRTGTRAAAAGPGISPIPLLATAAAIYLVWILLFQNVIHQTRHVLPLVPPLLMLLAAGGAVAWRALSARIILAAFLAAYAFTGLTLARQHMRPAAIAQAKAWVETFSDTSTVLVAAPWVEKCLSAQGVKARFLSVETPEELEALPARLRALPSATPLIAVGDYRDVIRLPVAAHRTFHHNPYVNRLGSRVDVFVYHPGDALPP